MNLHDYITDVKPALVAATEQFDSDIYNKLPTIAMMNLG